MTSQRQFDYFAAGDAGAAHLHRGRTEEVVRVGYIRAGGTLQGLQGDESFPFVKDPPQASRPLKYVNRVDLGLVTQVSQYLIGDTLKIPEARSLSLYVNMTRPTGSPGILSILPQAGFELDGNDQFFPLGVVDTTLTVPGVETGYAERNVLQTELTWDPDAQQSPAPGGAGPFPLILTFDVSTFESYRFLFGSRGGALRLTAHVVAAR